MQNTPVASSLNTRSRFSQIINIIIPMLIKKNELR